MKSLFIFRGQGGTVLVIALLLMTVLSLIGAAAVMTSSIEVKISGNEKSAKEAFYTAEAGIEHIRGMLESLFVENNAARIAAGQDPDWDFALNGSQGGISAATSVSYEGGTIWINGASLGGNRSYSVRIWNNEDSGSATDDSDRLIFARSEGSGPSGSDRLVEVLLEGGVTGQDAITGYTAQEGAGAGKNYNANDLNAINAGDLTITQLNTSGI